MTVKDNAEAANVALGEVLDALDRLIYNPSLPRDVRFRAEDMATALNQVWMAHAAWLERLADESR